MMSRRECEIKPIHVNRTEITKVIIDSHFEVNHSGYMSDDLILKLVRLLDGRLELPEAQDDEGFKYFSTLLSFAERQYRLVWLLERECIYIGVLNAYRDNRED